MPSTALVVASVVLVALLVIVFLRSRSKPAAPASARIEPPREGASSQTPTPGEPANGARASSAPRQAAGAAAATAAAAARASDPPQTTEAARAPSFPPTSPPAIADEPTDDRDDEPTSVEAIPPSTEEIVADQILETSQSDADAKAKPPPAAPPPVPKRPALRSYSNITDQAVLAEAAVERPTAPPPADEAPVAEAKRPASEPKLAPSAPKPSEAKVAAAPARPLPASAPKVVTSAPRVATSEPKVPVPVTRASAPKLGAAAKLPASEPKLVRRISEPKLAAASAAQAAPAVEEHDLSGLAEAPAPKPDAAARSGAGLAAKYSPPTNPATAELEQSDARHAAARRLARISVSEIKLYHEDEVKAGREANDLWKRLQKDITLALQTFETRVAPEVRERFDYLYDEILRQLADGDPSKLGPDAPTPKGDARPSAPERTPEAAPSPGTAASGVTVDLEAPTKTVGRTLEPAEPKAARPSAPSVEAAPPASERKPAEARAPSIATRAAPSNPETADLEKNDPRHAAARRLARLSVSEIKLYHEDEVKAGREANDLWKRLTADIGLATQTFEKRVDKEVRDRFDYLYDEILRQLAEGDASRLGPDAPKPKAAAVAPTSAPKIAGTTPASAPKVAGAAPASAPKVAGAAPASAPKVAGAAPASAPKIAEASAAPAAPTTKAAAAAPAARYAPPSNPETAELEKSDPRHAAARRLARLSVSEIKLYHEAEVTAGREAKDLWKRLTADIGLATQTFEKRVDKEVRDRFDYLYDEILRQLAEGDASKLGPDAPKPKNEA